MRSIGFSELWILFSLLGVFACWKIVRKAGYPGVASLLILIPVLNLVAVFFLAFADWPVLRELRALRALSPSAPGAER